MKRLLVLVCLVALAGTSAFAIDGGFDLGIGATYEFGDNIITDNTDELAGALSGLLNTLTALRAGGFVDGRLTIIGPLSAGAELGIFAFASTDENGDSTVTPLVDIPVRAFVRATLGGFVVQAHAGYNFATYVDLNTTNGIGIAHKLDLGARVALGPIYFELDQLLWEGDKASTRIGFGLFLADLLGGSK